MTLTVYTFAKAVARCHRFFYRRGLQVLCACAGRSTSRRKWRACKRLYNVQVKSGEQTNQETTTEHVAHIHRVLKSLYAKLGNQALPYFEFVIHPQSFAKTCENIFHLSFLVNEGHARVTLDENNLLLVEPVGRDENNTETRRTMKNVFAMTLNMQQWRDAVRALQITRLAIPS